MIQSSQLLVRVRVIDNKSNARR